MYIIYVYTDDEFRDQTFPKCVKNIVFRYICMHKIDITNFKTKNFRLKNVYSIYVLLISNIDVNR